MSLQRKIGIFCAAALFGLCAACATIPSQIVSIGPNTYQLNMTGVGFATQGNTSMKALEAANAYCGKMGERMELRHSEENGVYGFSPRQDTIVFGCLPTAAQR